MTVRILMHLEVWMTDRKVKRNRVDEENMVLAEIGRIISSFTDMDKVYEQFAEQVRILIPFDRLSIITTENESSTRTNRYNTGVEMPGFKRGVIHRVPGPNLRVARILHDGIIVKAGPEDAMHTRPLIEAKALDVGLRSGIMVSLISNDTMVGILSIRSKQPRFYDTDDLKLAQRVGSQIAGAIASGQLQENLERQARERSVLADIGRIIGSSLNIDEVYGRFASRVQEIIPFDRIAISTVDPEQNTGEIVYVDGVDVPERRQRAVFDATGSVSGKVAHSRKTLLISTDSRDEIAANYPALIPPFDSGNRSFLTVPLISNDNVIGVLHIRSNTTGAYTSREIHLAEQVGDQIAGAIANSQLHASVQRDANERRTLAKIGQIISSSLELEEVYEQFCSTVRSLVEFDHISINTFDLANNLTQITYNSGIEIPERHKYRSFSLEGTVAEKLIRQQATLLAQGPDAVKLGEEHPGIRPFLMAGMKSFLSTPLFFNDSVIAMLSICTTRQDAYTERDAKFLERVATQIAGAIASSQLYAERKRAEEALRKSEDEQRQLARNNQIIAQTGRIIGSTLDINNVYDKFSELVKELVPSDRITINLTNQEEGTVTTAYASGEKIARRMPGSVFPQKGTLTEKMIQNKKGVIVQAKSENDLPELLQIYPGLSITLQSGFKSILGAPLISNDRVIGTIQFRTCIFNAYTEAHLNLAERVADQIAGAIANSQLYEQTIRTELALRKAEEVQRRLAEENALLANIGRIIGSSLNIGEVFESFSEEVRKLISFDRITVGVVDFENNSFRTPYSIGIGIPNRNAHEIVPLAGSVTGWVAVTRKTFLCLADKDLSAQYPPNVNIRDGLKQGIRSFLSVPLVAKGEVIGVFHLRSKESNAYTLNDTALAESIGVQISGAVANARLYDELINTQDALKELASELSRSNNDLAYEISERERFEDALKEHADELSRSNSDLERFAYVASHDLQEPLRKIQSFGDLLDAKSGDMLDEQARSYLDRMMGATDRMRTLIEDLLTFSRVTTQAKPFERVNLGSIVREVLSDLEVRVSDENAQVDLGELPVVEADPLQIRQLMQNLISNALKFHQPELPPIVKIHSEIVTDENLAKELNLRYSSFHRIFVDDSGIGFDEKYLDRIFTIFQRLHGRTRFEGTGIGLAICRKIVERHNGLITAKSSPGQGASFIITMPMSQNTV
jgi:GAF domain-containing protein